MLECKKLHKQEEPLLDLCQEYPSTTELAAYMQCADSVCALVLHKNLRIVAYTEAMMSATPKHLSKLDQNQGAELYMQVALSFSPLELLRGFSTQHSQSPDSKCIPPRDPIFDNYYMCT